MSALGKHSTTDDVLQGVDLSGKTVFITGANSGLGLESARAMAAKGARVIMAGRDPEKLDAAFSGITSLIPKARLETILVDLASLESVRTCAAQAQERLEKIDVLVNNAAVMACPLNHTADGFEMQFGTNHLGHFALTNGLMPLVLEGVGSPGSGRIVNLSSRGHFMSDVDLDDPNFERRDYNEWISYGQAKTANALFSVGLERRFADRGVHAIAVHPGGIQTNLGRHLSEEQEQALIDRVTTSDPDYEWKTIPQGAATQVWAATATELEGRGGIYCEDCRVAEVDDESRAKGVRSYALDPARADALWTLSEELTGESFGA
ncbi:MAG: SDR family NAD(P)-dependent oxidoreductase [Erythrobacter sp.]|uniref:SDR family NAD(P)-dependent oxidoreductase n=1 Tax=Erythrobacter sp. TaxID=1042 RepID=UPI0026230A00|nr:SDR family NAD(P)-dependent oxidoreductase [Erythrobacter sp.]MDJ0979274.1 SDR family NAD(P)-dependent oxidoreductase [Erythrobacter sp.]